MFGLERLRGAKGSRTSLGCHPHQSKIGSEEPIFDSFSLEGEAFGGNRNASRYNEHRRIWDKASPLGEKPLVGIGMLHDITNIVGYGTRLLPSGRHPRVASLAPSGQFTFSCQPPALRNRGLTDVGHRRRRQMYSDRSFWPFRLEGSILYLVSDIFYLTRRRIWSHSPKPRLP